MALSLSYVDRPKLGGSLVIFFCIMGFTLIDNDDWVLAWMSIRTTAFHKFHNLRRGGFLRVTLFPSTLKYDDFIKPRTMGIGKKYLLDLDPRSVPPGQK